MLIIAREARNLNQMELAEKIKMSATNLSKIERGDIGISDEVLSSISDITGYPKHFFQQPGEIIPPYMSYRKRDHVPQKFLTAINAKANIIARHVQFLQRSLEIPVPKLPFFKDDIPQKIAFETRRKWNVPEGPIVNVTRLLEQNGIVVSSFEFNTQRVDSKSLFTDEGQPIIFLNSSLLGDRQRFTLAFELGQLLLFQADYVSPERDINHEANAFAAEFLLPAEELKEGFKKGVTISILAELKKKWKVSMIALLYRANDLGFITSNQKRYLLQQFNQLQIRRREPRELDITPENANLLKEWISTYRTNTRLGAVEMAALLCLSLEEFMEFYL